MYNMYVCMYVCIYIYIYIYIIRHELRGIELVRNFPLLNPEIFCYHQHFSQFFFGAVSIYQFVNNDEFGMFAEIM